MTLQLLVLVWTGLSAAGLAAAAWMLARAWCADEFPSGHTRGPLRPFRAPG